MSYVYTKKVAVDIRGVTSEAARDLGKGIRCCSIYTAVLTKRLVG